MMGRTGTIYYDKSIDKYIIDKPRSEMSLFELTLLDKTNLYTNKVPKKDNDDIEEDSELEWEKRLRKKQKKLEKKNQKAMDEFWDEYFKWRKNPKKYENHLTKDEKLIMKYFNKKAKQGKNKKERKEYKKAKKDIIQLMIYEKYKEEEEEFQEFVENRSHKKFSKHKKKSKNPNRSFFKRNKYNETEYNEEKQALLKNLECEILERLNDVEIFGRDNLVVDYNDYNDNKKQKKKKKKDIDRMII